MQEKPIITFDLALNKFRKLCSDLINGKGLSEREKKLLENSAFIETVLDLNKPEYRSKQQLENAIKENTNILTLYKDMVAETKNIKETLSSFLNNLNAIVEDIKQIKEPKNNTQAQIEKARLVAEEARRKKKEADEQKAKIDAQIVEYDRNNPHQQRPRRGILTNRDLPEPLPVSPRPALDDPNESSHKNKKKKQSKRT